MMFPGFRIRGCKSPVGMRTETDCFPNVGVLVSHGARGCVLRATSGGLAGTDDGKQHL